MDGTIDYDILISGGGLVGASLACALGGRGLRVGMIEAVPFGAVDQPSYDDRAIALAQGTQRVFAGMGLWPALEPRATPIHKIHVSDRGRFGFARLDRDEEGVPALGYVALARDIGATLGERLATLSEVELRCPASVVGVETQPDSVRLRLETPEGEQRLTTRLLVAADGAQSTLRELLQIPTSVWEYGQSAVIANVTPERPHQSIAYERFTDTGPIALLPMSENRCALVWTLRNDQVNAVMSLEDAEFLTRLQERFGNRLGRLQRVGHRVAYSLRLVRARESVRPRVALIGNAAHTLHPIAGQGFNLGLRDVAALAEVLLDAHRAGRDIGDLDVLRQYAAWRQADHRRVIAFTDSVTRMFSNALPPIAWARDIGMLALDMFPPAKRLFARTTMGRAGRLPRLARGLSL
ncbi:MAG: 2-octaprenyl-6-methoxyphenyl hydroxylase [Thiohalobacteraceae bacterium]